MKILRTCKVRKISHHGVISICGTISGGWIRDNIKIIKEGMIFKKKISQAIARDIFFLKICHEGVTS